MSTALLKGLQLESVVVLPPVFGAFYFIANRSNMGAGANLELGEYTLSSLENPLTVSAIGFSGSFDYH
jgi:hypothetical protein